MSTRRNITVAVVIGLVFGIAADEALQAIFDPRTPVPAPLRPASVPASARWNGGPTGGNWFICAKQTAETYRCEVFADVTGVPIAGGLYKLSAENHWNELKPILVSDTEIELVGARLVKIPE